MQDEERGNREHVGEYQHGTGYGESLPIVAPDGKDAYTEVRERVGQYPLDHVAGVEQARLVEGAREYTHVLLGKEQQQQRGATHHDCQRANDPADQIPGRCFVILDHFRQHCRFHRALDGAGQERNCAEGYVVGVNKERSAEKVSHQQSSHIAKAFARNRESRCYDSRVSGRVFAQHEMQKI